MSSAITSQDLCSFLIHPTKTSVCAPRLSYWKTSRFCGGNCQIATHSLLPYIACIGTYTVSSWKGALSRWEYNLTCYPQTLVFPPRKLDLVTPHPPLSTDAVIGKLEPKDQATGLALPSVQIYLPWVDETIWTCVYLQVPDFDYSCSQVSDSESGI